MRENTNFKWFIKEKKKNNNKRPLLYDATFDEILYLIVGNDKKKTRKAYRLPGLK